MWLHVAFVPYIGGGFSVSAFDGHVDEQSGSLLFSLLVANTLPRYYLNATARDRRWSGSDFGVSLLVPFKMPPAWSSLVRIKFLCFSAPSPTNPQIDLPII